MAAMRAKGGVAQREPLGMLSAPPPAARPASCALGHFIWHDLITSEVGRAVEFYSNVLGWQAKSMELGPPLGSYIIFTAGSVETAGLARSERSVRRSYWLPYVAVRDVEETCRRADELGGTVRAEPTRVPRVGRFGIVADPLGAVLSPIELVRSPAGLPRVQAPVSIGEIAWDDLLTADPEAAGAFWAQLLFWRRAPTPSGTFGSYVLLGPSGERVAGILRPPTSLPERIAMWIATVRVGEADATARRAELAGASALLSPFDLPGIGRLAMLRDPCGAVIALYESA